MTVASRTSADPLGPDSLTWKYFGDLRTGMMGVWIGAIQNMYPELGAGVEEHSILLREPLQRVARSVYPIMGVVYDGDRAAQTGQQIKGYHRTIKGVDAEGRRYHALNPDTFYWAHATFFMLVIKVAEYFCGGLTEAEKHQLFEEHVRWYRMYGMSMRPVPKSWEDFQDYWDRVCRDKLEINQATVDILQMRIPKPRFVLMPTPIWDQLFKPLIAGQRWIAAGLFDPAVREKAGMHWTPGDEVLLRVFGKVVELAFLAVPDEIRLHPRALAAYRRAAGRTRHDAPLVQAPGFMAPPRDRQGLPMHYFHPVPIALPGRSRSRQGPDGTRRGAGPFHTFAGRRAAGAGPQPRCVGPDNQRRPNARALSYRQIAAAAATLRLSAPPDIGMCTRWSAKPRSRPTTRVLRARTAMPSARQAADRHRREPSRRPLRWPAPAVRPLAGRRWRHRHRARRRPGSRRCYRWTRADTCRCMGRRCARRGSPPRHPWRRRCGLPCPRCPARGSRRSPRSAEVSRPIHPQVGSPADRTPPPTRPA